MRNNENASKSSEKRCNKCNGCGLMKVDAIYICAGCRKHNNFRCYLCENVKRGYFEECDKCYGTGGENINYK